ncbi:LysR family nitrogen assimilation transcriptional regulator [Paraburkholderia sp. GAS206C]|uniref:LysR family transcriptional regulator n=1 Tax=unclassified Paraburkholderia TaxID=2615204 RepID=UPI003D1EACCC
MDLKQLRALVTVAETGNVTRASALLNVVQPAVSRYLRLLEEDMGVPLFVRSCQGMELTPEGRTLVDYARRVLSELEHARAELRPAQGNIAGTVSVGLLPSISGFLCSDLVSAVARSYGEVQLRIVSADATRLQSWIETGEIDVAVFHDLAPVLTLQTSNLLEEDYWVVGARRAHFSPDAPVTLDELANMPLILPRAPLGLRSLVDQAARLEGLMLNVVAETNSVFVQRALVLGGHGVTILPRVAVIDDVADGKLTCTSLIQPNLLRRLVLAQSSTRQATKATACVAAALTRCMQDAVSRGNWPGARWISEAYSSNRTHEVANAVNQPVLQA